MKNRKRIYGYPPPTEKEIVDKQVKRINNLAWAFLEPFVTFWGYFFLFILIMAFIGLLIEWYKCSIGIPCSWS